MNDQVVEQEEKPASASMTLEQIKEDLVGKEFTYYPVNRNRESVKVTVVKEHDQHILVNAETREPVMMVGIRWTYVHDCYSGLVTEFKMESPNAPSASGPRASGPSTPRAPRSSAPAGPRYPQVGKAKEDPYPDAVERDGVQKLMFWTNGGMKNFIRAVDEGIPNDRGILPDLFLSEFKSQFNGPEDSKDSMIYLTDEAMRNLYDYLEFMQVPESWPSSLKTSSTAVFKRTAQYLMTKDGKLPEDRQITTNKSSDVQENSDGTAQDQAV